MSETPRHPETGEFLRRGTRLITLRYRDQKVTISMPGWYADDDTAGTSGIYDPEDMKVSSEAKEAMKRSAFMAGLDELSRLHGYLVEWSYLRRGVGEHVPFPDKDGVVISAMKPVSKRRHR